MVRAPPCHGGSCGFEPRLPRILFFLFLFLTSCSSDNYDTYQESAFDITHQLSLELKQIRTRDDLLTHQKRLQYLFDKLVDSIIALKQYNTKHEGSTPLLDNSKENPYSELLRLELNRVIYMEGGQEIIEKAQENALNKLDLYERDNFLDS